MKENLIIKIIVVLLSVCLIVIFGYGVMYIINEHNIIVESEKADDKNKDESKKEDKDENKEEVDTEVAEPISIDDAVDELLYYFPDAFYAFDSEVEGFVSGNEKNVNNLSNEVLIKLAIYGDDRSSTTTSIPETFGSKTFGPDEKKAGDSIETRIFTHNEIKNNVKNLFGEAKANNLVFPEFIGYGALSSDFTNIYYSIDDKYYEGKAAVGNQVSFSKERVSYSFFSDDFDSIDGTLQIGYLVTKYYNGNVVSTYNVTEKFERDTLGNFTWISIKKD